jgi:PAS domain S-box-containing protein
MGAKSFTEHKSRGRKEAAPVQNETGQEKPTLPFNSTLFGLMFHNNPLPMWLFDLNTLDFIEVNRAAVLHYGYSRDEFLGMRISDIRPPEQISNLLSHLSTLNDDSEGQFEGQHLKKNGEVIDVYVTGLTLRQNIRFVLAQDVTEHKKIESDNALLAAIVESSEDAIIGTTLGGIIVSWNPGSQRMYGYTAEEITGQSVLIIVPPDRKGELQEILEKIKNGEPVTNFETIRRRKDGTDLHISLSVSPIKDKEGNIIGASAVGRDISERHELDRRKNEFLSLASHELRTPIAVIRGFAQLGLKFATESGDQRLVRTLQGINENTTHISRLVNDLLDVSRIDRASLPIHPEQLDLRVEMQKAIDDLNLLNPDLVCSLDMPSEPVMVRADSHLIRQVVNNLIENAIKYSPDQPKVEAKVVISDGEAVTSIRDFGIGIPAEEQERIFDRFYRASNAGPRSRNGLGLGLFITRDIVQRHGGRLWLESASEAGSTFYFSLPLGDKD